VSTGTVVVTGAGGGIGAAIVRRFCEAGWTAVGVDLDGRRLAQLEAELAGPRAEQAPPADPLRPWPSFLICQGDVAEPATHERAAALAAEAGGERLCWINNAGYNVAGSVHELKRADYERGLAVNLGGTFWGTASAVRLMLAHRGGAIVNVTSTHALVGFPGFAAYASAKAGIVGLTRQVAAEFAGRGIRCNAVAPGLVHTPLADAALAASPDPNALRRSWDELCPIGRWGQPADVADVALFLAGPDSAFITGQVLVVDGGQTVLARGEHVRPP
jgi:NAD(P)-dependent dehydrogenase (short-subunit alcohol dehydrogenase family)